MKTTIELPPSLTALLRNAGYETSLQVSLVDGTPVTDQDRANVTALIVGWTAEHLGAEAGERALALCAPAENDAAPISPRW